VTGSISAPGLFEGSEYNLPKDHPLRAVFLYNSSSESRVQPSMNLSFMHGVRTSLVLQKTGDIKQALAARNPDNAPHLSFIDAGGHGYSVVHATSDQVEVEFVCIPRPLERSDRTDGGPLAYRIVHRVKHWKAGESPVLERTRTEGTLPIGFDVA